MFQSLYGVCWFESRVGLSSDSTWLMTILHFLLLLLLLLVSLGAGLVSSSWALQLERSARRRLAAGPEDKVAPPPPPSSSRARTQLGHEPVVLGEELRWLIEQLIIDQRAPSCKADNTIGRLHDDQEGEQMAVIKVINSKSIQLL